MIELIAKPTDTRRALSGFAHFNRVDVGSIHGAFGRIKALAPYMVSSQRVVGRHVVLS